MTKKDYELIAAVIYSLSPDISDDDQHKITWAFVASLQEQHKRFNIDKFVTACVFGTPAQMREAAKRDE